MSELRMLAQTLCMLLFSLDQPTKQEKIRMAESIIAAFPILKNAGKNGYVSYLFYLTCEALLCIE